MAQLHAKTLGNVLLLEVDADPNASLSAAKGTLALDSTNGAAYINTDGSTAWSTLSTGGGASVSDPSVIWSNQESPSFNRPSDQTSTYNQSSTEALYIPFHINSDKTAKRIAIYNNTVGGNLDCGIYDVDGTKKVTSGSTAMSGADQLQMVDIANTALTAGNYYMAIVFDGGVNQRIWHWMSVNDGGGFELPLQSMSGMKNEVSFPLPSSATFSDLTTTDRGIPIMAVLFED